MHTVYLACHEWPGSLRHARCSLMVPHCRFPPILPWTPFSLAPEQNTVYIETVTIPSCRRALSARLLSACTKFFVTWCPRDIVLGNTEDRQQLEIPSSLGWVPDQPHLAQSPSCQRENHTDFQVHEEDYKLFSIFSKSICAFLWNF